ncbi:hypothetical protein KPSA1B_101937 [Pseudomonas syringae pv. actinidiae]|uniref:Uncharacterized protein n=1 Tax=Pseudomonas syringae pv. actinidiae TaxID=103796 RepID=A0A2V0Q7L5_PSESF|nr:hypothetical protein KPSA1B_101937 [Pseudomonas syringae pv. actinidiae]GBH08819.1 hypothetical protein KPSA1_02202 [Pseudomonas syringae pv. actinidiae]
MTMMRNRRSCSIGILAASFALDIQTVLSTNDLREYSVTL